MADDEVGGLPHLADRLNVLFARVPRPGTKQPYSNDRAAEDLSSAGYPVTGAYLSQLRSGKKNNPSARLLAGIAELFEVPITYFFEDEQAEKIEEQLNTLVALRNAGVRGIVARSAGMSDAGIASLALILEQLRRMEGLDDGDEIAAEPPAGSPPDQ
jgi:transcriptional regulator with XRE-family HTH domain